MKIPNIILSVSLILLTVLSGCAHSIENATIPPPATPLLATSSATSVPSFSPLPTYSPTSEFTPTVAPTLPIDQAQVELLEMLSNNGGCQLPCLWGIVPGKSTYQEAQAILLPLTSISVLTRFRPESGAIFPIYANGDLQLYNAYWLQCRYSV